MKRCPITCDEIPDAARYSPRGLKLLARNLQNLRDFPYSAEEQRQEAVRRASKMSIQGLQPKLSARLNVPEETFEVVDAGGGFILKPPTHFPEVPANEALTMSMAELVGIEVPLHGMIYSQDGSLTYFVKRFDRTRKGKLQLEDFAQLLGMTRETKYGSSMEQVASVLEMYCTFPLVEKLKLLKLTLFNFLVGNEDAHLKNFSLIRRDGKIELSPAYDLLNTTIVLGNATEEIALPIQGRKRKLSRSILFDYFGRERLGLTRSVVEERVSEFKRAIGKWERYVEGSFLSEGMKKKYAGIVSARMAILG